MTQAQQIELKQAIDTEITARLNEMKIPEMHLERAVEVTQWVAMALHHRTPDAMGCDYQTYKDIAQKELLDLNMRELGIAINAVVSCTPQELRCIGHAAYIDIQDEVRRIAGKWNAIVKPMSDTIRDKHMKSANIIKPTNGLIKA